MGTRLDLPVKRSISLTEGADTRLRVLGERYGMGDDYLMVVLLEHLDTFADPAKLDHAFLEFIAIYGAPKSEDPDAPKD